MAFVPKKNQLKILKLVAKNTIDVISSERKSIENLEVGHIKHNWCY